MNIASHLTAMAGSQPWRPAVVFPHTRDQQGRVSYTHYTFRQLDEASGRLALGFSRLGIQRGMRVALMVPPSLDFFALTFALFKLGAVPVLIDPGIGLPNLGKGLAEAAPEAFIGIPKAHAARVLFGWARTTLKHKVTVGDRAWLGGVTLNRVRELGATGLPASAVEPVPYETAAILFTSGSTGPSKGVVYTHEYFAGQVEHIRQLYNIQPGEIDLPTFPLFALFGPALGMTAIIPDMDPTRPAQVDPAKIVEAVGNFGVTNMFGSPAVIRRVGRYGDQHSGLKLPSLRRVISAGAPVPAKELQRFSRLLPPGAQVFTPYGATECLPVSSIGSDEILSETRQQTDLGRGVCVGRPVPGLTVKIIKISDLPIPAWDQALEVGSGEIGEIAVKGPHVTRVYFNRPEATELAKIADGPNGEFYHRMGDLGALARSEPLMKGLARLRAALRMSNAPEARAELINAAFEIGEREGLLAQVADLFAEDAAAIVPARDWGPRADLMVRGLVLAHRPDSAERWYDILDRDVPGVAATADQLQLVLALAAPGARNEAGADLVLSKLAMVVDPPPPEPPLPPDPAAPDQPAFVPPPPPPKPTPETLARATLDFGLFDALGRPMPPEAQDAVESLVSQDSAGRRPAAALMQRIDRAATAKSRGEVALSVVSALGTQGARDLAPDVVVKLVHALRIAGIQDGAEALALEALALRPRAGASGG